jgi:hypothetical protein
LLACVFSASSWIFLVGVRTIFDQNVG